MDHGRGGLGGGVLGWGEDAAAHFVDETAEQLRERAAAADGLAGESAHLLLGKSPEIDGDESVE
jgi:hypothetical protein